MEEDENESMEVVMRKLKEKISNLRTITRRNNEAIESLRRTESAEKFNGQKEMTRTFLCEGHPTYQEDSPYLPINQKLLSLSDENKNLRYWIDEYRCGLETVVETHVGKIAGRRRSFAQERRALEDRIRNSSVRVANVRWQNDRLRTLYESLVAYLERADEGEQTRHNEVMSIVKDLIETNESMRKTMSSFVEKDSTGFVDEPDGDPVKSS